MTLDLSVRIGPALLPNPVGVASGTFGFGTEYGQVVDIARLGAVYTKAVTLEPRAGNASPRIVETTAGMLNSIGLANPGVEAFLAQKSEALADLGCPVFVNVAGASEADYEAVVRRIEAGLPSAPGRAVVGYEVNLSCPNVKHGGLAFGTDPAQVERVTASLRKLTSRALVVKLTPNVADIASIAVAAERGGADAVSCVNTLVGMRIDVRAAKPFLAMGTGGLSGPAIKPVGVACVWKASRAVGIPVIGLGGIMDSDDALEYLLAGASAVQVGTGVFVDPAIPLKVIDGIAAFMGERGLSSVGEIRKIIPR